MQKSGEKLPYIIFVGIEIADLLFDDPFYEMGFAKLSHLAGLQVCIYC